MRSGDERAVGMALLVSRQAEQRLAELEKAEGLRLGITAEVHHILLDLDEDSQCRLPGCFPMCPPKGTDPPGGAL